MDVHKLLMIDLSRPELTPDERAFLASHKVGGVCLFARNIRDRDQLANYTAELRSLCGEDFLIAADQEGGGVVRALDLPYPPGAMALGAANDAALTREVAAATARGLRAVGVNIDFAPVADVNNNPKNPVIADRAFGSQPEGVAEHVVAFIQGLQAEGVAATAKHFPGHGDTDTDSHLALPCLDVEWERLERLELVPFKAAIGAGVAGVMSFHGLVPAIDPDSPATLSSKVMTGLLRDTLGFDGVTFTDALSMQAIADAYGPAEAAVRAVAAGVDMPVHTGPLEEHEAILKLLEASLQEGRLMEDEVARSVKRLYRLARRYPARPNPDAAWRDGDQALLDDAARRALVKLGELSPLQPSSSLVIVAAGRVVERAASELAESPAGALAKALEEEGFKVTCAFYDREAPLASREHVLHELAHADTALFISTARTRMSPEEKRLGLEVARAAKSFVHISLWNPYHACDLPGPALVSFGFRPISVRAVTKALASGDSPGKLPVPLETA